MRRWWTRSPIFGLHPRHRLHRLRPSNVAAAAAAASASNLATPTLSTPTLSTWHGTAAAATFAAATALAAAVAAAVAATAAVAAAVATAAVAAAAPGLHGDVPLRLGWYLQRWRPRRRVLGLHPRHRLHRLRSTALDDCFGLVVLFGLVRRHVHHRWQRKLWRRRVLHDAGSSVDDHHRHRVQHRGRLRFHQDWERRVLRLHRADECASGRRNNGDLVQR